MSGHGTPVPMMSTACGPLTGEAHVPGDKSISHRSLILGALSVGETRIEGLLEGEDVLDTARAMRAFGAEVIEHGGGRWSVHGVGVGGFREPGQVIDCGNSGTGVRLIMGAMATSPISRPGWIASHGCGPPRAIWPSGRRRGTGPMSWWKTTAPSVRPPPPASGGRRGAPD